MNATLPVTLNSTLEADIVCDRVALESTLIDLATVHTQLATALALGYHYEYTPEWDRLVSATFPMLVTVSSDKKYVRVDLDSFLTYLSGVQQAVLGLKALLSLVKAARETLLSLPSSLSLEAAVPVQIPTEVQGAAQAEELLGLSRLVVKCLATATLTTPTYRPPLATYVR